MRLARTIWDWTEEPFYRSQNDQAAATDPFYWRLVAWAALVLSTVLVLLGGLDTGALHLVGWYALHCLAAAHFASQQPRLYARWRPPICLANWLHQGWTFTQVALLSSSDVDMRNTPALLLLISIGLWNGSLFMLCSTLRAPLLLWWNSFALPVAAAVPVWCSGAVCRLGLLQAPGAAAAIVRLYRALAWAHVVVALPGVADPALHTSPSALHCCWVVHTWTLVTATVLLPWVRVWQRERHARRRFAWQRLAESAGEARAVAQAAPSNLEGAHQQPPLLDPPPATGPAMARVAIDPWQLADDCRPAWAWVLDAYLLSCAAWAALLLYATARGF